MKIEIQSDNHPMVVGVIDNTPCNDGPQDVPSYKNISVSADSQSKIYIQLAPNSKDMPRRHQGELVLSNGWVHLDYDSQGFLVGLEIVEGDPFTGTTEAISYLQPINPLLM